MELHIDYEKQPEYPLEQIEDPKAEVRADDDHYILRLIGQVITVSLETQQIIATLPSLNFPA